MQLYALHPEVSLLSNALLDSLYTKKIDLSGICLDFYNSNDEYKFTQFGINVKVLRLIIKYLRYNNFINKKYKTTQKFMFEYQLDSEAIKKDLLSCLHKKMIPLQK